MSIHNKSGNIKWGSGHYLIYVLLLISVAFSGYGIGLLRSFEKPVVANITKNCEVLELMQNNINNSGLGQFWASKSGSVYYPAWCKAGLRVKEENRLYFGSSEEAEIAGLTLSKQCNL